MVRALLRSPLRRLLSNQLMLLSYHGRRTGHRYTIPVGYFPRNDGVLAFSCAQWWVNLPDRQPAQLTIRGREHSATATVYDQTDDVAARLVEVHRTVWPQGRARADPRPPRRETSQHAELARAPATALIHFHLQTPI